MVNKGADSIQHGDIIYVKGKPLRVKNPRLKALSTRGFYSPEIVTTFETDPVPFEICAWIYGYTGPHPRNLRISDETWTRLTA